jgi:signal peptidase I
MEMKNIIRFYSGTSMYKTFFNADYLKIDKITIYELHNGDIVVFQKIEKNKTKNILVHRVLSISKNKLVTRGDNNSKNDEEPVTEEDLIGKVTHYERNGKMHKVWNGKLGLIRARVLHGRLHIIRTIKFFLRKPYRLLKKTGIISKFWRPEIEMIHFETQNGPLVKYVHKGKTVASCWTETNQWWFRRPYDFVIGPKVK